MEPAAAWGHWGIQTTKNWTVAEPAATEVWAPTGYPAEYTSIDIFGRTCRLPYVPEPSGGQQLVEHYFYSAATQHDGPSEIPADEVIAEQQQNLQLVVQENSGNQQVIDSPKIVSCDSPAAGDVCKKVARKFKDDMNLMKKKMHRYPAVLRETLEESYKQPRIVAIGPYHHNLDHLKKAEKVKYAAAAHCAGQSDDVLQELLSAVVPAAEEARRLYDADVMARICDQDFLHMMLFDACFLVQFIRMWSGDPVDDGLRTFFAPNRIDIRHDIMLLENQLPWRVVETVKGFTPVRKRFISKLKRYLPGIRTPEDDDAATWDENYKTPHLLGLLRHHAAIGRRDDDDTPTETTDGDTKIKLSLSAMDLAKIGITISPDKVGGLIHMGLRQEGTLFAKLSLAPLRLDRNCASTLVNLAAFELCTIKSFGAVRDEDSVVISYLLVLAMLVNREEDVQELRARGLLEGGGGLTNQEALKFFTSFQGLRFGGCYYRVMRDIANHKKNRQMPTRFYTFCKNHWKIIIGLVSGVSVVVGIIAPLVTIMKAI